MCPMGRVVLALSEWCSGWQQERAGAGVGWVSCVVTPNHLQAPAQPHGTGSGRGVSAKRGQLSSEEAYPELQKFWKWDLRYLL